MIATFAIWFIIPGVILLALSQLVYSRELEKDMASASLIFFIMALLAIVINVAIK